MNAGFGVRLIQLQGAGGIGIDNEPMCSRYSNV